jgi:hypothetical protein
MARKDAHPGASEAATDRRQKAFELRKAGVGYRAIAAQLGVSQGQACKDVKRVLKALSELEQQEADSYRTMELQRLDGMLLAISTQVRAGHLGAIDRALKISESRRKLLGIDAPTRSEHSGPGGTPLSIQTFEYDATIAEIATRPDDDSAA